MEEIKKKPIAQVMMTPIIDVMMIMLLFFMIAYARSSPAFYAQKVEIPPSSTAQNWKKSKKTIEITVDSRGSIIVNNRPISPALLKQFLGEQKKKHASNKVVVRGDQSAPYEKIIFIIDQVKESGIPRVLLLTRKKEKQGDS